METTLSVSDEKLTNSSTASNKFDDSKEQSQIFTTANTTTDSQQVQPNSQHQQPAVTTKPLSKEATHILLENDLILVDPTQPPKNTGSESVKDTTGDRSDHGKQQAIGDQIKVLVSSNPLNIEEYSGHLNRLATILYEEKFTSDFLVTLHYKLLQLMDELPKFVDLQNPLKSQLYTIIDKNFDILIKLATNYNVMEISTASIRFLTTVFMNLNYWEVYNLLNKKPVLYHFLNLIEFDLNECYTRFINDYQRFTYEKITQPTVKSRNKSKATKKRKLKGDSDFAGSNTATATTSVTTPDANGPHGEKQQRSEAFFSLNPDTSDHDKYVADVISGANVQKRKFRPDVKLEHHRIIKKPQPAADKSSTKSSNYDPDVIHECQLPSAEEPHKLCLRRFSRKYELIRHQETVHSKKKKLFKCFVCVKQNPGVGPRIFTRHDTLAKHIRVNHKISGKEAKAEVAYSKKHAEVVEEGDITVHVGRRKTKVDFELRAHMEKRKSSGDDTNYMETSDLESGEEEVTFNK